MKHNLRNRPKLERIEEGYIAPSKPIEHIQEIYNWFESFEKELRETMFVNPKTRWQRQWNNFVQEILGLNEVSV